MYLSTLNGKQKELFLELALHVVSADGNYSDPEKAMMEVYCQEMQIPSISDRNRPAQPLSEIVPELMKECGEKEKKIILFEIIGLAVVDGKYDRDEHTLIGSVKGALGLSNDFADACEVLLTRYLDLQADINTLVIG